MVQLNAPMVGVAGEQIVIAEFARRGVEVYTAAGPYTSDLMIRVAGRTYSVQVKATEVGAPARFWLRRSKNRSYSDGEIDLFAVVEVSTGRVALLPHPENNTIVLDFDSLRPEWDFDNVINGLREGGT